MNGGGSEDDQHHGENSSRDGKLPAATAELLAAEDDDEPGAASMRASSSGVGVDVGGVDEQQNNPPPSSVHGEADDEENWSRHVETEHRGPPSMDEDNPSHDNGSRGRGGGGSSAGMGGGGGSSAMMMMMMMDDDDDNDRRRRRSASAVPQPPEKPELTLKEKLVLRERQRRIETERARLKRQFAQTAEETAEEGGAEDGVGLGMGGSQSIGEGTLGEESTRAHADEESSDANRLGFNMERFLRNSDSFNPQLEPMTEDGEQQQQQQDGATTATAATGVVMERFLNDPVVVPDAADVVGSAPSGESNLVLPETSREDGDDTLTRPLVEPHRSVSFDVEGLTAGQLPRDGGDPLDLTNASIMSNAESISQTGEVVVEHASSAVSMEAQRDAASSHEDVLSTNSNDEEPRVLRLTEADMLEMASIEEASIGNAPPSDRDEEEILSEIGELAGFGGGHHHGLGGDVALSHDTRTTAMESASQISGNQSQRSAQLVTSAAVSAVSSTSAEIPSADHHSVIEGIPPAASDPPHHLLLSPGAGSVVVHPPSEGGRDDDMDDADVRMPSSDVNISRISHDGPDLLIHEQIVQPSLLLEENVARVPEASERGPDAPVNRQRRYNAPHDSSPDTGGSNASPHAEGLVEGFDFDKNAPVSPEAHHDSFHDLPSDQWSPQGQMHISPLHARPRHVPVVPLNYGAVVDRDNDKTELRHHRGLTPPGLTNDARHHDSEHAPLLGIRDDIPPEIITRRNLSDPESGVNGSHDHYHRDHKHRSGSVTSYVESIVEDVFHEVRSVEEEKELVVNESDIYLASSIWARGT